MTAASAFPQGVEQGATSRYGIPDNGTDYWATYQCHGTTIPVVDTPSPYCLVPGGVRAMDMCCSTIGNETSYPQLEPDCYVWCAVNLVRAPGKDALAATHAAFLRCLQTGKDAENVQLSCGLGTGASSGSGNPTTITSPTSSVSSTGGATGSTAATTTTTASSTSAASSSVPPAAQTTTTRPSQAGLGAVRHGSLAILGLWMLQGVLAGAL